MKDRIFSLAFLILILLFCSTSRSAAQTAGNGVAQLRINLAQPLTLADVHKHKKTWRRAEITLSSAENPTLNHTDSARFRGRGNSSWGYSEKKPYRFKLDKSHPLLGGAKGKSWVLLSQPMRGSLLTNPIAFRAAQLVGTTAANHVLPVELYVNRQYRGLYLLTEQVDVASNSVQLPDERNGALLELDTYDGIFQDTTFHLPIDVKAPERKDYRKDFGQAAETKFFDQLSAQVQRMMQRIGQGQGEKVVDAEAFARYIFVNALCDNRELRHPKSTFVHNANVFDDSSLWTFGPVWDMDWAYGYENTRSYGDYPADSPYLFDNGPQGSGRRLFLALLSSPTLRAAYQRVCHNFVEKGQLEQLLTFVTSWERSVRSAAQRDWRMWYATDQRGEAQPYPYAQQAQRLQSWLRRRATALIKEVDLWQQYGVVYDTREPSPSLPPGTVTGLDRISASPSDFWGNRNANNGQQGASSAADVTFRSVGGYDLSGHRVSGSTVSATSSHTPRVIIVQGKKVLR